MRLGAPERIENSGTRRPKGPAAGFPRRSGRQRAPRRKPVHGEGPLVRREAACEAVYATDGYGASAGALAGTPLRTDMVFRDHGAVHRLATTTGDAASGDATTLTVGVRV